MHACEFMSCFCHISRGYVSCAVGIETVKVVCGVGRRKQLGMMIVYCLATPQAQTPLVD